MCNVYTVIGSLTGLWFTWVLIMLLHYFDNFLGNRLSVSNISNKYSAPLIFNQSTVCRRVQYSSYVKINLKLLWHVSWIYLFDRKRSTFCNRLDSLSSRFWCVTPLLVWELDSAAARDYIYGQHLFVDIIVKYWVLE